MQAAPSSFFISDPLDVFQRLDSSQFDLIYLDPPFYTVDSFTSQEFYNVPYHNIEEYLKYLVMLFIHSHRVLKPCGSVLLVTNPLSPINSRLFMDRIFGKNNFRAEIIWKNQPIQNRSTSSPYANFTSVYFYSRSNNFKYFEPYKLLSEREIKLNFNHHDNKGFYKLVRLWDHIDRFDKAFTWKNIEPPKGYSWKYSEKRLNELDATGDIINDGKILKRKVYSTVENYRVPLGFVWDDLGEPAANRFLINLKLQKAIEIASEPGDLIFTPFLTPLAINTIKNMNRYWVGASTLEKLTKEFFEFLPLDHKIIDRSEIQSKEIVANDGIPRSLLRTIEAEERTITPQVVLANIGQRYAFLVGINHYKDRIGDLRYCVNDVVQLEDTLKVLGYQVKTLHDDLVEDTLIPNRSNIETELQNLTQSLGPDDTLLVHFSGHGTILNNEARIIASDTRLQRIENTSLPLSEIISIIKSGRARKLILCLDICHGGVEMGRAIVDHEFIQNVYENAEGFVLLAASTAQQQAYELPEFEHGLFTYYLIQGLLGDADNDDDGRISVEDIRNYILNSIRQWNSKNDRQQEPTFRSEGIGEITLVNSN